MKEKLDDFFNNEDIKNSSDLLNSEDTGGFYIKKASQESQNSFSLISDNSYKNNKTQVDNKNKNNKTQVDYYAYFNNINVYSHDFDYINKQNCIESLEKLNNLELYFENIDDGTNLNYMSSYERMFLDVYKNLNYIDTFKYTNNIAILRLQEKFESIYGDQIDLNKHIASITKNSGFLDAHDIKNIRKELCRFIKRFLYNNDGEKTFNNINSSLKVSSTKEYFISAFMLGVCVTTMLFFLFMQIFLYEIGYKFKRDTRELMSMLTIQISFSFFLYYSRNVIENMDRFSIHWREVTDLTQVRQNNIKILTWLASVTLVMFMINQFLFLLFNFGWISNEFLKWYYLANIVVPFIILILPFDVLQMKNRYYAISKVLKILGSPFTSVTFVDVLIADMFTSSTKILQTCIKMIQVAESLMYHNKMVKHTSNILFNYFAIVVIIPFWIRLMQCLNQYYHSGFKLTKALVNAGKYMTSLLFIVQQLFTDTPVYIHITLGILSTTYSFLWDIFMDWDAIHFSDTWMPYIRDGKYSKYEMGCAILIDLMLRCSWILTLTIITPVHSMAYFGMIDDKSIINIMLICLELYRRLFWCKYRIENQARHLPDKNHMDFQLSANMLY